MLAAPRVERRFLLISLRHRATVGSAAIAAGISFNSSDRAISFLFKSTAFADTKAERRIYSGSLTLYVLARDRAAVWKGAFKIPGNLGSAVASSFGNMGFPQRVNETVAFAE